MLIFIKIISDLITVIIQNLFLCLKLITADKTTKNTQHFGSRKAKRQRFGRLHTWPHKCKQTPSLRFPIFQIYIAYAGWETEEYWSHCCFSWKSCSCSSLSWWTTKWVFIDKILRKFYYNLYFFQYFRYSSDCCYACGCSYNESGKL